MPLLIVAVFVPLLRVALLLLSDIVAVVALDLITTTLGRRLKVISGDPTEELELRSLPTKTCV